MLLVLGLCLFLMSCGEDSFLDRRELYRINNLRRVKYAKELMAKVAKNMKLAKGEVPTENYYLPFEERKPLIDRGLIRVLKSSSNKTEEIVVNEEGDEIVRVTESDGTKYEIRYVKSFSAKFIQADDETKGYYQELKNEALSYLNVNSRVSWHYDSIVKGKEIIVKLGIRGKTLCIYYPLDIDNVDTKKYKVEKVESLKYAATPCMYRINNPRRLKYAKELLARVARKLKLEKGEETNENYYLPFEERDSLVEKGLIRKVKVKK